MYRRDEGLHAIDNGAFSKATFLTAYQQREGANSPLAWKIVSAKIMVSAPKVFMVKFHRRSGGWPMSSIRLPIVEASELLGSVAKIATEAGVGAALVRKGSGLSLLHIDQLTGESGVTASAAAGDIGRTVPRLDLGGESRQGVTSFGISMEDAGFAYLELGDDHLTRLNAPLGYKECSIDAEHTYPPSFPKSDCPHQDGGKLKLKYF